MKTFIVLALLLFLLSACATGSAIVTGTKRPPTNPEKVQVLLEMPVSAEVIGIVKARSLGGLTDQDKQDYALQELKEQAAKLGANAMEPLIYSSIRP